MRLVDYVLCGFIAACTVNILSVVARGISTGPAFIIYGFLILVAISGSVALVAYGSRELFSFQLGADGAVMSLRSLIVLLSVIAALAWGWL